MIQGRETKFVECLPRFDTRSENALGTERGIEITPAVFQGGNSVALEYPDSTGPAQSGVRASLAPYQFVFQLFIAK